MTRTTHMIRLLTIVVAAAAPALLCASPEANNVVAKVPPHLSTTLPDCDRIEILLLGDVQEKTGENLFPIEGKEQGLDARYARILSRTSLAKSEATKLCKLWRSLTFDLYCGAKEQVPDYGLRFYRNDKLEFQTSIGFSSQNFTYPVGPGHHEFHGFEPDESSANLHKFLKAAHPRETDKKPSYPK